MKDTVNACLILKNIITNLIQIVYIRINSTHTQQHLNFLFRFILDSWWNGKTCLFLCLHWVLINWPCFPSMLKQSQMRQTLFSELLVPLQKRDFSETATWKRLPVRNKLWLDILLLVVLFSFYFTYICVRYTGNTVTP